MNEQTSRSIQDLEIHLDYQFKNKSLLETALTHKSTQIFTEDRQQINNERLEFLGDSVISLIASSILIQKYPGSEEGLLSKRRAQMVSEAGLQLLADRLEVSDFLKLGKSENLTGGRQNPRLIASAFEAVVGALFLDSGFQKTFEIISPLFLKLDQEFETQVDLVTDFKTKLQEVVQERLKVTPGYRVVSEVGPSHDKSFAVEVTAGARALGRGVGKSKKNAEQAAAKLALEELDRILLEEK